TRCKRDWSSDVCSCDLGQFGGGDILGGEALELGLLLAGGRSVHAGVPTLPVGGDLLLVHLAGGAAGDGGDLPGQQREQDAVLIGGPHAAVLPQEGGTGRFLC